MRFEELSEDRCRSLVYSSRVGTNAAFATFRWDEGMAITIHQSFHREGHDQSRDVILFNNQLLRPCKLIFATVDPTADRATSVEVMGYEMDVGPWEVDNVTFGDDDVKSESKLGGRPFAENEPRCRSAFDEAASLGYRQLAQLTYPSDREHPACDGFPFDPGWLHVFVRGTPPTGLEFAFVIQH